MIPNDYTNFILFPGSGFHTSELKLTSAGKREVSGDQGGFWFMDPAFSTPGADHRTGDTQ